MEILLEIRRRGREIPIDSELIELFGGGFERRSHDNSGSGESSKRTNMIYEWPTKEYETERFYVNKGEAGFVIIPTDLGHKREEIERERERPFIGAGD